jgi:hypothetical protein
MRRRDRFSLFHQNISDSWLCNLQRVEKVGLHGMIWLVDVANVLVARASGQSLHARSIGEQQTLKLDLEYGPGLCFSGASERTINDNFSFYALATV